MLQSRKIWLASDRDLYFILFSHSLSPNSLVLCDEIFCLKFFNGPVMGPIYFKGLFMYLGFGYNRHVID